MVLENTTGGQVLPPAYRRSGANGAQWLAMAHLDGVRMFNAATANAARNGTDVTTRKRAALCQPL